MRVRLSVFSWLLLGCIAGPTACKSPTPVASTPTTVKVATIVRSSAQQAARFSAQVEPATRLELAFRVGGYVEGIAKVKDSEDKQRLVQSGDAVHAGHELASLRKTDYALKINEAKAALGQARAGVKQAQLDCDRAGKLAASGSIATAEFDAARNKLEAAKAAADGAQARLEEARTALADTSLRSPLEGVILKRSIEVGTLAAPGTVAFSLADTQSVKVVFGVPDSALVKVRLGAPQAVTTETFPDAKFEGRVTRISPVADPKSRVFEVEVTISNLDQRLKPGMVASLALEGGSAAAEHAPTAPLSAIVRGKSQPGQFGVFVVVDEGGKPVARLRDVTLGDFAGNVVPVKSGLSGGERVVVMGAGLLSDGDLVGVVE